MELPLALEPPGLPHRRGDGRKDHAPVGGATEGIREGLTGYSFAEGDVKALARILIDLLKDDKILVQVAERGPNFVSTEFDLTRCTQLLEGQYDAFSHQFNPRMPSEQ